MTVQSQVFGLQAGQFTLPQYAQAADALLIAAGWTRAYLSAAAIGTGTSAAPKFDGTSAAINSLAAIAVYTMPANGQAHQWVVEFEWRWGANATTYLLRLRTATAVDGSGNLTAPGVQKGSQAASTAVESWLIASEHGFTTVWANGAFFGIERVRTRAGVVTDDVVIYGWGSSSYLYGFTFGSNYGLNQSRNWSYPQEYREEYLGFLTGLYSTNGTQTNDLTTLLAADGTLGVVGPEVTSNGRWGNLRHIVLVRYYDFVAGTDIKLNVDGADRRYTSLFGGGTFAGGARPLVARE